MLTHLKTEPAAVYGIKISNSKGVPGTFGCLAWGMDDGKPVVLSNWHIMFGKGSVKGDKIWMVEEKLQERSMREIGIIIKGKVGVVQFGRKKIYVDCAVSSLSIDKKRERKLFLPQGLPVIAGTSEAISGEQVYKYGSVTGMTKGRIISTEYNDKAFIDGQIMDAPGQLLIREENGIPFSGAGDSGAVIINTENKVVGLLWGTNEKGEGLACPIEPVLSFLNIGLVQPHQ